MARRGFTLFQLLVVLAAGAMLLGLLLPVVGQVRLKAARSASANNLKQIGLGTHIYHDNHARLQPGVDAKGFSAHAYILPFIEQDALFKAIDFKQAVDAKANAEARKAVVKTFVSPFDPVKSVSADYGPTNYLFCAGSLPALAGNNGMFPAGEPKITLAAVTNFNGLSNTVMVAETLKGDGGMKAMDVRRQHVLYKAEALQGLKEGAGADDWKADKNVAADRGASWMDGRFLQGTFAATYAVNDPRPDVSCAGLGGLSSPRSVLPGTNVLMGDGSVRFISDKAPAGAWQKAANWKNTEPFRFD